MSDPTALPTTSIIPVNQLDTGMFVAELDRPWLGTPFLLQGFLIESADQIAELQSCCQSVVVDHARSLGAWRQLPAARPAAVMAAPAPAEKEPDLFYVFQEASQPGARRRGGNVPQVRPEDGLSRFDEEVLYSAPLVEDVVSSLRAIQDEALDTRAKFAATANLIGEMAQAVERNPDALVWLTRLKATDEYSYDHALDVSVHLMVFGRFLGLGTHEVEQIGLAGLMQDVGKIHIAPEILQKPGKLSPAEYELIKAHVASSLDILVKDAGYSSIVLEIVANHHERFDGSGYPRSLTGTSIPLACEAAGLIDTYCAMIRDRPYEIALSSQRAMEHLIRMRGKKFRDALVEQFVQCMGIYPVGSLVELNSGEVALVVQQNRVRRLQPKLLVVLGPDKSPDPHPRTLDLILQPRTPVGDLYRIMTALPGNAYGIDPRDLFAA